MISLSFPDKVDGFHFISRQFYPISMKMRFRNLDPSRSYHIKFIAQVEDPASGVQYLLTSFKILLHPLGWSPVEQARHLCSKLEFGHLTDMPGAVYDKTLRFLFNWCVRTTFQSPQLKLHLLMELFELVPSSAEDLFLERAALTKPAMFIQNAVDDEKKMSLTCKFFD
jgi:hypothetical protein